MIRHPRRVFSALIVAMGLLLTACIPVTFQPHVWSTNLAPAYYPPGETHYYDWFWMGAPDEMIKYVTDTTGSPAIQARVCFPATAGYARQYLEFVDGDTHYYSYTYGTGCTAWVKIGAGATSYGWQRFAGIGAGETFEVQMGLFANYSDVAFNAGMTARVATASQSPVWFDF